MFKMLGHENIDKMTTRFMHIINQLKPLGKRYTNAETVRKILRSLSKAQPPKVAAIQEAKDLTVLSLDALIGYLKTHEIELNEAIEESNRKGKSIALKSTQRKVSSSKAMKAVEELEEEEESFDDEEEKDEIAHVGERISKAQIKRKKKKGFVPKKDEKGKAKQYEVICFECKKPGHVRSEYPKLKKNLKKNSPKKKAMMATREDVDKQQECTES